MTTSRPLCSDHEYLDGRVEAASIDSYRSLQITSPALIAALFINGCTPAKLVNYRSVGVIRPEDAITFIGANWDHERVASAAIDPLILAAYLRCNVTEPLVINTFVRLNVTPKLLSQICGGHDDVHTTTAAVMPLPDRRLEAQGRHRPIRFRFNNGELRVDEDDHQELRDELLAVALGAQPTDAVVVAQLFHDGVQANLVMVSQVLNITDDFDHLMRRWVRAILDGIDRT